MTTNTYDFFSKQLKEPFRLSNSTVIEDLQPITKFPVIKTTNSISTRTHPHLGSFKQILQWTADTDMDDLIQILIEEDELQIDYRTIVALLSIYNRGDTELVEFNEELDKNQQIQDLLNEMDGKINPIDVYSKLVLNIIRLNYHLSSMLKCNSISQFIEDDNNCISIFRGFNPLRYDLFLKNIGPIEVGTTITTPTFLSTSINSNTALRFTNNNGILWEIRVIKGTPGWDNFRYTFLGLPQELDEKWEDKVKSMPNGDEKDIFLEQLEIEKNTYDITKHSTSEDEILLNINSMLFCSKIDTIPQLNYITPTGEFEIFNINYYVFEFIQYDQSPISMRKLLDYLGVKARNHISEQHNGIGFNETYQDLVTLGGKRQRKTKRKRKNKTKRKPKK